MQKRNSHTGAKSDTVFGARVPAVVRQSIFKAAVLLYFNLFSRGIDKCIYIVQ